MFIVSSLVVTAVSPNVVVTILLRLNEQRLGMNKGIHTLIIAMTSCNDVIAIFLFGVVLASIFSTGSVIWFLNKYLEWLCWCFFFNIGSLSEQMLQGPVGIGIGIVYGFLYGLLLWFLPSNKSVSTLYCN